jgi:hypothetical protein
MACPFHTMFVEVRHLAQWGCLHYIAVAGLPAWQTKELCKQSA